MTVFHIVDASKMSIIELPFKNKTYTNAHILQYIVRYCIKKKEGYKAQDA